MQPWGHPAAKRGTSPIPEVVSPLSLTLLVEAVNVPTARVTVTASAADTDRRANGFVWVNGEKARAYVARWHPQDIGSGRWP